MATSCFITDYTTRVKSSLYFTDADFAGMIDSWEEDDALLVDLADQIEMFEGRTQWGMLDPMHWQLVIATHFRSLDGLTEEQQRDHEHPTVISFRNMLMGLILCIEEACMYAHIDTLKVSRVGELDCSYEFTLSMMTVRMGDDPEEKPRPTLSVVVDNSDKK